MRRFALQFTRGFATQFIEQRENSRKLRLQFTFCEIYTPFFDKKLVAKRQRVFDLFFEIISSRNKNNVL